MKGRAALALAVVALTAAALLAVTQWLTAPRIERAQRAAELARLSVVLPARDQFDNDPVADVDTTRRALQPHITLLATWPARRGTVLIARAFKVATRQGYGGTIELLVGVRSNGEVISVRVLDHRETPGLGDPIAATGSDWINAFVGRTLNDPAAERWTVKKDGGEFDQFSGATISPRAVVLAVKATLEYAKLSAPSATLAP